MSVENLEYSPNVLIYLEVGGKKVRLSDVLIETATLYEKAEFPPGTQASLVFFVGDREERDNIILHEGISKESTFIKFSHPTSDVKFEFEEQCK